MALVRWEPARELSSLQSEMNRLFSSFFETPAEPGAARRWTPAMDLVEVDTEYVVRADLPGVSEEDVHVEVEGDVLTISGERKAEHEERKEGYYRIERSFGSFRRAITLPEGVDISKVGARFEKGVLEVRVPKPVATSPQKVRIAVGSAPDDVEGREAGGPQPEPVEDVETPLGGS